ncbi:MAG: hypothetical protein FWG50_00770 [Kiritimatiellaeota bacterium]|nr:hypothetical protein [Kiritimatiellota bacterium]MCL1919603.1 hypothetical protein [Kiritimatiellota bacterium]
MAERFIAVAESVGRGLAVAGYVVVAVSLAVAFAARLWESGLAGEMWREFVVAARRRDAWVWALITVGLSLCAQKRGPAEWLEEWRERAQGGGAQAEGGFPGGPQRGGAEGGGRVVFQSGVPLAGPLPGVAVRCVMLSCNGAAEDLATLLDAPEAARLRMAAEGGLEPWMDPAEASLTGQFALPSWGPEMWRVVTVDLGGAVPLGDLLFGDAAGLGEWARQWRGEIAEAVFFDDIPGDGARAGVANWLAARRGAGRLYPATAAERGAAIAAGLNSGVDWATVIIVR